MMQSIQRVRAVFVMCASIATVAGRDATGATAPADLVVSVGKDTIAAPDSVRQGWTRVRVDEDGAGHIVVVFRLAAVASPGEVASLLTALDTAAATPKPWVAMGGPEVGDTGHVVLRLTPGRYLFGCVRRAQSGHRHASTGEAKLLVVTRGRADAAHASPPRATQRVRMLDFAYQGADSWKAGTHMLRIENSGKQDHQLRLVRLRAGSSMADWMSAEQPGKHGVAIAGVARMSAGEVAYLPVDLSPGTYVANCLVTDAATGHQHMKLGMLKSIQVK